MLLRVSDEPIATAGRASFLRTWRFAAFIENWAWEYRRYIWLAIAAFYLLSFNGLWRPTPDSALYLSIGRSIARGEGYVYLGEAHRMAYPGLPHLIAGAIEIFGQHATALVIATIFAMALASLALAYRLFRLIVRPGTAVVALVITSVNFKVYSLAFDVLTDVPFLLGTMMVLLGAAWSGIAPPPRLYAEAEVAGPRQRKLGWMLLPAGLVLCAVMRPTFYLLAGCVMVAGLIQIFRARKTVGGVAISALAAVIGLIFLLAILADPRRAATTSDAYEQAVSWHIKFALSDITIPLANGWAIISPELPSAYFGYSWSPFLDPIAVAALLAAAGWVLWRWPLATLWICATLVMQLIVEPVPRYMLPIIPLLSLAWWESASRLCARLQWRAANVIAIAAYLIMVPNFFRGIGQVWFEQYQRPFLTAYHQGKFAPIDEMARRIQERVPKDAVLVTPERTDRVFTYLADRWSIAPNQPVPERLRKRPVWVVFAKQDPDWRKDLLPLIKLGKKDYETTAQYRSEGALVLREATWIKPPTTK